MFIFHDFLDPETCAVYKQRVSDHYQQQIADGRDPMSFMDSRNLTITDDPIRSKVQEFLESRLRVRLHCHQVELQTWPIGCPVGLHRHDRQGRETGDYNSLLYLNSNFSGGEFYTDTGIILRPSVGTLTFFDGSKVMHGVRPVAVNHRHTIIFWWESTEFY